MTFGMQQMAVFSTEVGGGSKSASPRRSRRAAMVGAIPPRV